MFGVMSDWWTYRPEDFLLFSPRVYWRLIELHNQALWPWQLLALLLGGLVLAGMLRPRPWSNRLIAALLAVAWVFVAWTFLWQRYATINWAVTYVVPLFVLQALLLIGFGTLKGEVIMTMRWSVPRLLGIALFLYALLLHPLLPIVVGRSLHTAEVFGMFPDPLAIATLGMLTATIPRHWAWPLLVIPALWCLVSWLTLDTMQAPGAWIPLLAVVIAIAGRLWGRVR
ncbi:hypothetical protein L861_22620 [Litchfieldella anticariensis FP35 = DSM 16096]|uniref:MFS transporter permease n=1 Tax=Litchfieldella anticariensis (strain DSM 16096 / CECT 5854 / CIP 108499 / LMG 22089 / FP35) TaxID=1121939 RepID=S2KLS6_LITA3|nr:DUF6064 family protein [Halomonas anticariensis]EPC03107.1 hypothetical protein L861_22620 [Halomonas anticariensis FP35 = DSM 16096]